MKLRRSVISMLEKIMLILRSIGLEKFSEFRSTYGFLYSLFGNKIVLTEVQGHKMYLDLKDRGVSKQLFLHGGIEKHITKLFKQQVKKGDIIVDVGAHVGYYTLLAAKLVGEKGKVFAFELARQFCSTFEKHRSKQLSQRYSSEESRFKQDWKC